MVSNKEVSRLYRYRTLSLLSCLILFMANPGASLNTYGAVAPVANSGSPTTVGDVISDPALLSCLTASNDVATVTSVICRHQPIQTLDGLQHFTNLTYLDVRGGDYSDLSPVANLLLLRTVVLAGSKSVTDFSPLYNLPELHTLNIGAMDITDISFLSNLNGLESLSLSNNREITNFSVLSTLTELRSLYLDYTGLQQLEILLPLIHLTRLSVSHYLLTDISPLASMTQLTFLSMFSAGVCDLSALSTLTALTFFGASDNCISDLSFLTNLTNLERLYLANNLLIDISVLSDLTQLEYLDISDNDIVDFDPISSLNLTVLSSQQRVALTQLGLPNQIDLDTQTELRFPLAMASAPTFGGAILTSPSGTRLLGEFDVGNNEIVSNLHANMEKGVWNLEIWAYYGSTREEWSSAVITQAYGFNSSIQFVGVEASDTTPPTVQNVVFEAVQAGNATVVKAQVELADDISGLSQTNLSFNLNSGSSNITRHSTISGTGTFTYVDKVDQVSEVGEWTFQIVNVSDNASNHLLYNPLNKINTTLSGSPITTVSGSWQMQSGQIVAETFPLTSTGNPIWVELDTSINNPSFELRSSTGQLLQTSARYHGESTFHFNGLLIEQPAGDYTLTVFNGSNAAVSFDLLVYSDEVVIVTPPPERVVDAISDPQLLGCLASQQNDLIESVTSVICRNQGVQSLNGLEYFSNLDYLDVRGGAITDLTPLANLSLLRSLVLSGNSVTDFTPLYNLSNLRALNLTAMSLTDISFLSNLSQVESLILSNNPITDFSALSTQTNLQTLYLGQTGFTDAQLLQPLTGLRSLFLGFNAIADISPLGSLINLQQLWIHDTGTCDLSSLATLTDLRLLFASDNCISDLSFLSSMTKLTRLWLADNNISSITQVSVLTDLTELDLSSNNISDISALGGLAQLRTLDITSNSITDFSILDQLNLDTLDRDVPPPPETVIDAITDPQLLGCLASQQNDLIESVTSVICGNQGVQSLNGLEHFSNLDYLDVRGGAITDLTPLANLSLLRTLVLSGNNVTDFTPLYNLTSLRTLNLAAMALTDISFLSNLDQITSLVLSNNPITDFSVLSTQTNLLTLYLGQTGFTDAQLLQPLTGLRSLFLGFNTIADISPLGSLINLQQLWIHDTGACDLSSLATLTELRLLFASDNCISDLGFLSSMTMLTHLWLANNNISDIAQISGLTDLIELNLGGNNISDISALAGLAQLRTLDITGNSITDYSVLDQLNLDTLHRDLADADGDGEPDLTDNCINEANADQLDTDGNDVGNACDDDDDGDGLSDAEEAVIGTDPLLADTDGDGVDDNIDGFPTDPTNSGAILAINDTPAIGQGYGHRYGTDEHHTRVTATFDGQASRWLHVRGYDVDNRTEIGVYINGQFLGYLPVGPNNGLSLPSLFWLPQNQLVAQNNLVEFRQESGAGYKWGVEGIGVLSANTALGNLGDALASVHQHGFQVYGPQDQLLSVSGFDAEADEIGIRVNGVDVGSLPQGPNDAFDRRYRLYTNGALTFWNRVDATNSWGMQLDAMLPMDTVLGRTGPTAIADPVEINDVVYLLPLTKAKTLEVRHYDIDLSDEVDVRINGVVISRAKRTPNNSLGAVESYPLPAGLNAVQMDNTYNPPSSYKWGASLHQVH